MPLVLIWWILLAAWLITHGAYRAVVGAKCAFQKVDPPWVKNRQEKLISQEIRRARRREVLDSPRTARGFIARLWGDGWEFANKWVDDLGNPDKPADREPVEAKPIVPADAGASWVYDLGGKATAAWAWTQNLWDRWWAASTLRCPWTYPVLGVDAEGFPVVDAGEVCGKRVLKDTKYCPDHQADHERGHCLWGDGNTDAPTCPNKRRRHFPFCTPHIEEWGNHAAEQGGTQEHPAPPGTLDTPEAPQLDTTGTPDHLPAAPVEKATEEQRPQDAQRPPQGAASTAAPRICQWGHIASLDAPDYGQSCNEGALPTKLYCGPHNAAIGEWVDGLRQAAERDRPRTADQSKAPTQGSATPIITGAPGFFTPVQTGRPKPGWCEEECRMSSTGEHLPQWHETRAGRQWGCMLCGKGFTSQLVGNDGRGLCMQWRHDEADAELCLAVVPPDAKDPRDCGHHSGYERYRGRPPGQASTPSPPPDPGPQPDAVTCRQTVDDGAGFSQPCGRPVPDGATTPDCGRHQAPPLADDPPQRPMLRVVPNTTTQGDTSMSAPTQQSTGEATNTQKAKEFAQGVIDSGNVEWPKSVEMAKQQMGTVELTNDPDVVHALGAIDEAAKVLAAAGQQLLTALEGHDGATEQVSALGAKAAKTQAYKTQ